MLYEHARNLVILGVYVVSPLYAAGDVVVVSMESKKVLMAAFLFYIMPLILFFCSYGILYAFKLLEMHCIIFASGIAFIYYILLYFYDKQNTDKYQHEIIKIN